MAAPKMVSWLMPLAPSEQPWLLRQTLRCLERQTLQADELVIAADGALPDDLLGAIRRCRLPMVVVGQERNLGIGATLAAAAPRCRGEYILRIDSDDAYASWHTAALLKALEERPGAGAIGGQLLELDSETGRSSSRRTPTDPLEVLRLLPWRNPLNHQTVGLRRSALLAVGGYRHAPGFEDWDLWLRMAKKGYELGNLARGSVIARVNSEHRVRRRGWSYVGKELDFFRRQVRQGSIPRLTAAMSLLTRLPWRLAPIELLAWWMGSCWRGSPPLHEPWVADLLADTGW